VYKLISLSLARINALIRAINSACWDVACVGKAIASNGLDKMASIMAYPAAG
jgi:hypothetical protein